MIEIIETRYNCVRDESDPDKYDEFDICQSQNDKVKVVFGIPGRWRNIDETIEFYEWVVSELKNFKKQRVRDEAKGKADI